MQAIIMAAGKGERLGEQTGGLPKSFLEIKGRRLIDYNLQMLRHFSIEDIIIVTGYRSECFDPYIKQYPGVRLAFNPFFEAANVLSSFWVGMEYLTDDFCYLHADTLCEPTIFREMLDLKGDIVLPVDMGNSNEEAMKIRLQNGQIAEISKEIPLEEAAGEFIGIAKIRKETLPDLKKHTLQLLKEKQFKSYFEAALQRMIKDDVFSFATFDVSNRFWAEIDFEEDYIAAKKNIPEQLLNI